MYPGYTVMPRASRRRPVHKSSSGCERCKTRKIKCDERWPSCTQCNIKQMECPGYPSQPRIRWSRKHEIFESKKPPSRNFMNQRRSTTDNRMSPDNSEGAGNNLAWKAQAEGTISLDPYVLSPPIPPYNADSYWPTFPIDEFAWRDIYDDFPDINTRGSSDIWSKEVYRTIMDPGDVQWLSEEGQRTAGNYPPNYPIHEEETSQKATITIPGTPGESLRDENEIDSTLSGSKPSVCDVPPSADLVGTHNLRDASLSLYPEPPGSSVELVPFYFNVVCPILSTFDSEKNVFRTFISKKWQESSAIFYTIQSMAAAKLVWFMPDMMAQALKWRSLALENLQNEISTAPFWNTELLFVVLLLGVSSSWFDIADLGIAYLEAVQEALLNKKVKFSDDFDAVSFFRNALIYWEMVSCAVSHSATQNDYADMELSRPGFPRPRLPTRDELCGVPTRRVPHPWTGVASEPQAIFARISRQIHALRTPGSASATAGTKLERPGDFLQEVRDLDDAVWSYRLPELHDICNVGDPNTPAVHHLLLAEAYMFANLYQLYKVFHNARRKRVRWIKEAAELCQFDLTSWAGAQAYSWARLLQQDDGAERWLRFLGRGIIIRLEQIQTTSGTSCVQALLLLVAATSLSLSSEREEGPDDVTGDGEGEITRTRRFVLDRLGVLSASNLSAPIQYVRNVVVEIFKRLDVGVDVFWMDVLQSMGLLTIIG